MYAVCNVSHVVFFGEISFPYSVEHLLAYLAVQQADTIDFLTGIAKESGHAELLAVIVGICTSHANELVPCDTKFFRIRTKVLAKQAFVEIVVPCRNRSMHRVQRRRTYEFKGLIERELPFLHIVNKALNVAECGMSFVAMVYILFDTEFLKHKNATNTQKILLLQTVFPITAIKRLCNIAVELGIHVVVGIEQIQCNSTNIYFPDISINSVIWERHFYNLLFPVFVEHFLNRQVFEILGFIVGYLLAVHGKALVEITVTIQETDSTHVNVRVGSLLDVIACQYTQAARIYLQYVRKTVFHAEVCNRRT